MMCALILLIIRSTEGATEHLKTGDNVKENQVAPSIGEKGTLLETKNISAVRGEDVTFVVDIIKESGIQDIQWVKNGVNFATTKPFQGVTIRDNVYDGRLGGSDDGSLIIHNLAMEDQGEYKADIVMLNLENYKIVYSLHISEENRPPRTHVVVAVVSVIVVLFALAAGAAFLMWKRKLCFGNTRRDQARGDPEGKSELETEELQQKEPSPSPQADPHDQRDEEDSEDEPFVLAPENPVKETQDGH